MRSFAVFYRLDKAPDGHTSWVEPCGDRRIVILDGRWSMATANAMAEDLCRLRGFDGWRLARGRRLDSMFYLQAAVRPLPGGPEMELPS